MSYKELHFRSNGKLLISSEYLVLDGAEALAIPTSKGQTLIASRSNTNTIKWNSYDVNGTIWFSAEFDSLFNIINSTDKEVANTLSIFLNVANILNPDFKDEAKGTVVETHLEFDRSWGLGSSSTLISNIAQWAKVDPFTLQQETFPGSGYDIACALSNSPIIYRIQEGDVSYTSSNFSPSFSDEIYFIHLNKKQNSREGIDRYRSYKGDISTYIEKVNDRTYEMLECDNIKSFKKLMDQHENIMSKVVDLKTVKELFFNDYNGSIKSLGAWGGDFIMAIGNDTEKYFSDKGYKTIVAYDDMVK